MSHIAQFQVNIDWVTEETLQKIITITITMLCLKLGVSEIVCKIQNQNTTVSSLWSLFTLSKSLSLPRCLVWLQSQVYPMVHQFNHINPFQSAVWDH